MDLTIQFRFEELKPRFQHRKLELIEILGRAFPGTPCGVQFLDVLSNEYVGDVLSD
jgi:hypothetical protein